MMREMPGFPRMARAMRYAWTGLKTAFREERAFQQESLAAFALVPLAFFLGGTGVERAILIGGVMIVLIAELLNTAAETIIERISPEWHDLSGRAKDISSAAVFVAKISLLLTWTLVLAD